MRKKLLAIFSTLIMASLILSACAQPTPEKVVETVIVTEKEEVEVEVVETVEVEVEKEVEDPENVPQELIDGIGVSAPDESTLVIELGQEASYFTSMTPLWTMTASPGWAIEAHGDNWIEAGNIVTNGRYVLNEWVHGVRRTLLRNPLMPEDMQGDGNIEKFVTNVVPDTSTGYALWLNNEVETAGIPSAELEAHLETFPEETIQIPDLAVFYISYRMTKAPFDDARVRRAFSAAFDRETFVQEVLQGQGLPMKHFAPPGIFAAPPIDEVGVGYDVEFAQAQLADAGYPDCEGFPQVTLLGYSGQSTLNWIEYAQAQWEENLGCSADLIQIEQQSFADLLASTKADDAEAPHMWTLGWGPDYADEKNWVDDVLYCDNAVRQKRECNEIDDMILEARYETDPDVRKELYREIEEAFFGEEGEYPFFPIYLRIAYTAEHTWLDRVVALFGGQQWYTWNLDAGAKANARGEAVSDQVTFDGYSTTDIPTLDPQLAEDVVSINYIENLFVHLTNYDLETAEVVGEAATDWTVSDDGLTYTFNIRTDIPWVKHNPVTGETIQEEDADGNPRFVTADDFVYGIKRACMPTTGSYYSGIIAGVIKGCDTVFSYGQ